MNKGAEPDGPAPFGLSRIEMAICRIDGILATEANQAVIFRRGPSRLTQLLVWDLNTDLVTPGQWLTGRVYTPRCDVSPNGEFLVISASNYSQSHRDRNQQPVKDEYECSGWTAISRPPFFTAIGLWFTGGAWNGGGIWRSNRELDVNNFVYHWDQKIDLPRSLKVRRMNLPSSENEPIFTMRLLKRGWKQLRAEKTVVTNPGWRKVAEAFLKLPDPTNPDELGAYIQSFQEMYPKYRTDQTGLFAKPIPNGRIERITSYDRDRWRLVSNDETVHRDWKPERGHLQWVDIDARGRVIFGENGCLWAWENFPAGEPNLIADLNPNKFESIPPPDWAIAR